MKITAINKQVINTDITETGQTNAINKSALDQLIYYVKIDAISGSDTPTMTLQLQSSYDGVNWFDIESSVAITATGNYSIRSVNFGSYIRLEYTITGTNPVFNTDITLATKG